MHYTEWKWQKLTRTLKLDFLYKKEFVVARLLTGKLVIPNLDLDLDLDIGCTHISRNQGGNFYFLIVSVCACACVWNDYTKRNQLTRANSIETKSIVHIVEFHGLLKSWRVEVCTRLGSITVRLINKFIFIGSEGDHAINTHKNIIWNKTEMNIRIFNWLRIYLFKNCIILGKSPSFRSIILYYSFQSSVL